MKKLISGILAVCLLAGSSYAAELSGIQAKSAILMTKEGQVLFEQNADESLQPASVTKIMTMLLAIEAIDEGRASLEDTITASAHAAEMGGTQIYLKEGETMSLDDMLKSIAVASANDAAMAVAEHFGGSEEGFVSMMNERAQELGCTGTAFVNPNGLDTDGEKTLTTARDLAKISAELMKHERVYDYTTIWMDTVRNGEFSLANTNKLLRQYKGMTGLKTGYTSEAGFCISATARRDGMDLIAVVMAEKDKNARNADVTAMLNYGFATYTMVAPEDGAQLPKSLPVVLGRQKEVAIELADDSSVLLEKQQAEGIERTVALEEALCAPVKQGQKVGELVVKAGDQEIARREIVASETIEAKSISDIFRELMEILLMKN